MVKTVMVTGSLINVLKENNTDLVSLSQVVINSILGKAQYFRDRVNIGLLNDMLSQYYCEGCYIFLQFVTERMKVWGSFFTKLYHYDDVSEWAEPKSKNVLCYLS